MRAWAAVALPWPGTAFAARGGKLVRLRLGRGSLVPLDDEFPTETDCAGEPGEIEVITSESPRTSQLLKSRAIAAEHVLDVRDRGSSRAGSRA